MGTLINRSLSLVVFLVYLWAAFSVGGAPAALKLAMFMALPMACIWFPEPMGDFVGNMRGHQITSTSPAPLVCALGWMILVGVPLIVYVMTGGK